ncbi:hypothetical protein HMI54_010251 [Coelomomyces lativittatus]|nr:hypothetical protein HMI54_010251 [Coelomomyces lativittatus]KAJ1514447.1 hypothetical protein HMI56_000442 [Coelomomyces lativittatus]KAJ1516486.1 hypothetical protein HMI55_002142 [Coelomomyces lativittatus]
MFDLVDHLQLQSSTHIALSFSHIDDPTFLFPLCICSELSQVTPRKVLFVSTNHSLDHYHHICKKMKGISLRNHPQFVWIDAISHFHAHHPSQLPEPNSNIHWLHHNEDPLETLYTLVQAHLPCLVLLDDLMPFVYTGITSNHILLFIRKLTWLMESSSSTLVSVTHRHLELPESNFLSLSIPNSASKVLLCDGLQTGYANDIDGEMMLIRGKHADHSSILQPSMPIQLHYKLLDSSIRFFGKGLSMQVG